MVNTILMANYRFLLIALLISSFSFGQVDTDTLNRTDELGRKQGYWVSLGLHHPEKGYPANGFIEEGMYRDSRKQGVWKKYYKNGKVVRMKANYENNRPSGKYWKYWENGGLKEKGRFEKGKQLDSLVKYFDCGNLASQRFYDENGKMEGYVNFYYNNCGCPDSTSQILQMTYKKKAGVDVDTLYRYYFSGCMKYMRVNNASGKVTVYEKYEDVCDSPKYAKNKACFASKFKVKPTSNNELKHTPDGFNSVYNKNGFLWMEGIFKDNKLVKGKVYQYDSNGLLNKVEIWKEGKYSSDGKLEDK